MEINYYGNKDLDVLVGWPVGPTLSAMVQFSVQWYTAVTFDLKRRDQNRIVFPSILRLIII